MARDPEPAAVRRRLPAGLEGPGRDETLTSGEDVHPSGMRADSRSSVPGTRIPGAPKPSDEAHGDEAEGESRPPSEAESGG
ncbi:MAG: hypothetical protein ACRDLO_09480 [Solirubrobacterales bacterium]